ncbi:MAG: GNAT family N-acetyltransferase [Oscillospiraceae bacterium]|nr:GNAT family N-acetyltransferase [Oscillospiraceae bacterium]
MNVIIKHAKRDEIHEIAVFLDTCWKSEYRGIVADDYLDSMSSDERHKALIKRFDENASDFLIMTENNRLIGAAVFGKSFIEGFESGGEISAIYLHKHYIGKGYGHKLFAEIERLLAEKFYPYFILDVLKNNTRAFEFYTKHGYEKVAERWFEMGGKDYPILIMRKEIAK